MARSQIRTDALTGSLPISTGSALSAEPALENTQLVLDELASSVRRIIDFDTTNAGFFQAPSTFKSMGTEGVFVATSDLFVTGTAYATSITGSGGLELVATSNGAVVIDGDSGATFTEDGTEVLIIDGNGDTRFASYGGSADDPDVEIDGFARFDGSVAASGSLTFLGSAARHDITKSTAGNLVLSGAGGRLYLIDSHVTSSDWSEKNIGIPLATSADQWTSFSNLGFNSILHALTSTGAQTKSTAVATTTVTADTATGLFSVDVSSVPQDDRISRIDVFVNGMLMLSGTAAQVTAGTADYRLDGTAASTDLVFSFALDADDQVAIIIR